jgi:uncharacterized protein YjiK
VTRWTSPLLAAALLAGCGELSEEAPAAPDVVAAAPAIRTDLPALDPATAPLAELLDDARALRWKLPRRLREISGLALTADGRLFAIADERAEIVELDYRLGEMARRFRVGDPVLAGDFEGLAAHDGALWTVTSDGVLLHFEVGVHRGSVSYERFETGLGERCELEGLAAEHDLGTLLLLCKEVYEDEGREELWLFRWDMAAARLDPEPIRLDARRLWASLGEDEFSPSGLALTPDATALLIVAARQRAVLRLDRATDGSLALDEVIEIPERRSHRQAEGIAVLDSGALVLADEGGNDRGRLAVYGTP